MNQAMPQFQQLPLKCEFLDVFTFDTLVAGSNDVAAGIVQQCAFGEGEKQVYVWSPRGGGKSHLLQAACNLAAKHQRTVCYLPVGQIINQPVQILDELEPVESDVEIIRPVDELFFWPMSAAYILTLLAALFSIRPFALRPLST